MFTIVGEALIDVVVPAGGQPPAEYVGGSSANVAIGLGRLGRAVELVSQVGADERGQRVLRALERDGVSTAEVRVGPSPTATATATLDAAGVATYRFDLHWDPGELSCPPRTRVVHTGSLATVVEPGASATVELLKSVADHLLVTYDPNCRPAVLGEADQERAGIEATVELAHVVKVSDEDLAWLYPGEDVRAVAERWLARGPALVIVTCGGKGALALGRGGSAHQPAPVVDVVDTVGAGDSFTAALLHALADQPALAPADVAALDSARLSTILRSAVVAAAVTCTRAGANPPTLDELLR